MMRPLARRKPLLVVVCSSENRQPTGAHAGSSPEKQEKQACPLNPAPHMLERR